MARRRSKVLAIAVLAIAFLFAPAAANAAPVGDAVGDLVDNATGNGSPPPSSPPPQSPPSSAPTASPPAAPSPRPSPAAAPAPAPRSAATARPVATTAPVAAAVETATPASVPSAVELTPAPEDAPAAAMSPQVITVRRASSSPFVATFLGALAALMIDKGLRRMRKTLALRNADDSCDLVTAGCASRRARNLQAAGVFLIAFAGIIGLTAASGGGIRQYGFIAMGYLSVKLVLSSRYKPHAGGDGETTDLVVAAIVPVYNEDPAAFERCLRSLLDQTHALAEIWVIDDGSPDPQCRRIAKRVLAGVPGVRIHAFRQNRGKREAQAFAFKRSQAEIFCTIDSDTVLDREAVAEGLKPFADERITAVTGNVRALNHKRNLLTKLIDLRYANAFLYERAAYSMLGSVLCACGSLSFWRSEVIKENLDDFVTQTFLGIPVQYGDDRRLTNYALQRGKVVVQDSSVAFTVVPERITHFVRQQLRWNKSFFRETLWVLRNFNYRKWVWWLSLAEIVTWATFSTGIVMATLVTPLLTGRLALVYYLSYMAIISYARSVRYLGATENSWSYQLYVFLLSPVYAFMHVALLIPLRIVALCTLRQRGWGTRGTVEVALTRPGSAVATAPVAVPTAAAA
ncbi:MAG: hyaluronan synthase [Actinomycetota bacterium]|jgi:hyaluronan synthase